MAPTYWKSTKTSGIVAGEAVSCWQTISMYFISCRTLLVLAGCQSPCLTGDGELNKSFTFGTRPTLQGRSGREVIIVSALGSRAESFVNVLKENVMKEANKTPKGWINIRVKPEEYTTIYNYYKATTCNKLSQYVRNVLLQKPVVATHRNRSADEILAALNALKKELSAIGNNFNQSVHKLHTYSHIPEIKLWAELSESSRQNMVKKVEEIRVAMNKIYEQWSHK